MVANVFTNMHIIIKSFIKLATLRRSVQRVCGTHLQVMAPRQHSSLGRNIAAVSGRSKHRVRFDRPEIRSSYFPLQRQTRLDSITCINKQHTRIYKKYRGDNASSSRIGVLLVVCDVLLRLFICSNCDASNPITLANSFLFCSSFSWEI